MTYLLDTQLLIWAAIEPLRLSATASALLQRSGQRFLFSAASIWEVAIKARKRPDVFKVDPDLLREALLSFRMQELLLTSDHAVATARLPLLHHDPFDRILVAQSLVEGVTLVTVDRQLAAYGAGVLHVG